MKEIYLWGVSSFNLRPHIVLKIYGTCKVYTTKRFLKNSKRKIFLPKEIKKDLEKLIGASS